MNRSKGLFIFLFKLFFHFFLGLDLLTVIPHDEILSKGIPYIHKQMIADEDEEQQKLIEFFGMIILLNTGWHLKTESSHGVCGEKILMVLDL